MFRNETRDASACCCAPASLPNPHHPKTNILICMLTSARAESEVSDVRDLGLLRSSFPMINFAALSSLEAASDGDMPDKAPAPQQGQATSTTGHVPGADGSCDARQLPPSSSSTHGTETVVAPSSEVGVQCDDLLLTQGRPQGSETLAPCVPVGAPVSEPLVGRLPSSLVSHGSGLPPAHSRAASSSGNIAALAAAQEAGGSSWKDVVMSLWENAGDIAQDMKNPLNGVLALSQNVIQVCVSATPHQHLSHTVLLLPSTSCTTVEDTAAPPPICAAVLCFSISSCRELLGSCQTPHATSCRWCVRVRTIFSTWST